MPKGRKGYRGGGREGGKEGRREGGREGGTLGEESLNGHRKLAACLKCGPWSQKRWGYRVYKHTTR